MLFENCASVKSSVKFEIASALEELHHNVQGAGGETGVKVETPQKGNIQATPRQLTVWDCKSLSIIEQYFKDLFWLI